MLIKEALDTIIRNFMGLFVQVFHVFINDIYALQRSVLT